MHIDSLEFGCTQFREAAKEKDDSALLKTMSNYGMQVDKQLIC